MYFPEVRDRLDAKLSSSSYEETIITKLLIVKIKGRRLLTNRTIPKMKSVIFFPWNFS